MCYEQKNNEITLIIVDDHTLVREGISQILDTLTDIKVVGKAGSGQEALDLVKKLCPDVVLMDISLPEINGIESTRRILQERSDCKIAILSMHSERQYIVEAMRAGAKGYLLKNCTVSTLYDAVTTVAKNGVYFYPPYFAEFIFDFIGDKYQPQEKSKSLSNREQEVLRFLVEGKNTKEIASYIGVSVKTVEFHRYHIKKKLDIHNLAELTKFAVREGFTSL